MNFHMPPPDKPSTGSQVIAYALGLACVAFGFVFIKIAISDGEFNVTEIMFLVVSLPVMLIGIGIISFNTYSSIEIRKEEYQNGLRFPDAPWEWRHEWADGRIKCDTKSDVFFRFVLGFFLSCIFLLGMMAAISLDNVLGIFFASLVGLLAGVFVLKAIGSYLNYTYFGPVELHLDEMPAKIGGKLHGVLHGLKSKSRIMKIKAVLGCRQHVPREDDPPEIKVIYEQRKKLRPKREVDDFEFHIPIEFDIPDQLSTTNWQDKENWIEWVLVMYVNDKGREHKLDFNLPIF